MIWINDFFLIQKIKNGDPTAWESLVNKYYDSIFSYCVRRCFGNRLLAADLTQDIFLKLVENIHRYRFSGKFYNYLFTIAVNTCHNYTTKKKFDEQQYEDYLLPSDNKLSVGNELIDKERNKMIQEALDLLNPLQREAVILKYYHSFKVKEIAEITGVSVPTAQSRIHQGLKKLRKVLERKEFWDG
ncbi:hypothetical protein RV15_GL003027 [Enterococcus silesiacus]|uniref:RNA polymerase subunit sigma-70 n=1 Tax=Enterococcus silesiacus TaxID=332949 RepID=A0AA91GLN9_9ENTE|nr:hypothetical protein RV15_GL003027 [Enterococcus silesiacus]